MTHYTVHQNEWHIVITIIHWFCNLFYLIATIYHNFIPFSFYSRWICDNRSSLKLCRQRSIYTNRLRHNWVLELGKKTYNRYHWISCFSFFYFSIYGFLLSNHDIFNIVSFIINQNVSWLLLSHFNSLFDKAKSNNVECVNFYLISPHFIFGIFIYKTMCGQQKFAKQ